MSKNFEELKKQQLELFENYDVKQDVDRFLTRTLFLEKIRIHQEEEYNKGVELINKEKEELSTLEKYRRRAEFDQRMEALKRESLKLEITTYEKMLKEQLENLIDPKQASENARKSIYDQKYDDKFNEVLKNAFPQIHKELTNDLKALRDSQKFDSSQAVCHLLGVVTKQPNLSKELAKIYQEDSLKKIKENAKSLALTALKHSGAVINPYGYIIKSVASRVSEIPVMKSMINKLNSKFDEALDVLGVSDKYKKYIKVAGGIIIGGVLLGQLAPTDYLNADELLGDLETAKETAANTLEATKEASLKAVAAFKESLSSNVPEPTEITKEALVKNSSFVQGLDQTLKTGIEKASFKAEDLIVEKPEIKTPEVYNDIAPENLVVDPERAAALKQTMLTGEVPEILKQDGVISTVAAKEEILADLNGSTSPVQDAVSTVATKEEILGDLSNDSKADVTDAVNSEIIKERIVKEGEHFRQIVDDLDSKEFDLKGSKLTAVVNLIAEQNNIPNPDKLSVGQVINMPHDTASLKEFCEVNKDRLAELMKEDTLKSDLPRVNTNMAAFELPSHTTPVSASPNGFTQEMFEAPIADSVVIPKELMLQNSRLIASNILEGMPKEELDSFMKKVGTDERQLLDVLSANVEKQIMQDPEGQFSPHKIVLDFNQDREALEKEYGRTITNSMLRRMGGSLEIEASQIMTAYSGVEKEISAAMPAITQAATPPPEMPNERVSVNNNNPEINSKKISI